MKSFNIIIALVISVFIFSCSDVKLGEGIKKLDDLKETLETAKTNFEKINSEKISLLYDTMMQDIDTISKYTNKYPDNKKLKEAYSLYSETAHMAKNFFKRSYNKEIEYSETQIKNLRIDIENNALELDSLKVYLLDETNAISILDEKIKIHLDVSNQIIDKYNRTKPIVNQYIDSLRTTVKH